MKNRILVTSLFMNMMFVGTVFWLSGRAVAQDYVSCKIDQTIDSVTFWK